MSSFGAVTARPSDTRSLASRGFLVAALAALAGCGGQGGTAATSAGGAGSTSGASSTSGAGGASSISGAGSTGGVGSTGSASTGGSTPGGKVELIAGAIGEAGDVDGPLAKSRLLDVGGMAYIDPTLYVADRHHGLRKINVQTGATSTAVDDNGVSAKLFQPVALTRAGANELFVLVGLQTMSGVVGQLARYHVDSGVIEGEITPDSELEIPYDLVAPVPLAVEKTGSVLLGDAKRVDPKTQLVSDIGIDLVWGTSATLTAWAPGGDSMYSLHRAPSMVLKTDLATKTWELVAGDDSNNGQPAADGPKGTSRFSSSVGDAAYDGQGHLFVADTNANAIRKVDVATGAITTVIGELSPSGSIVLGDLDKARLHHPVWLAWLGGGRLAIGCPEDFVVLLASGL